MGRWRTKGNPSDKRNRWRHIMSRERGMCFWCDCPVERRIGPTPDTRADTATMDHIQLFARGGTCRLSNIVLSCFACNSARGGQGASQWATKKGKSDKLGRFLTGEYQAENLERVHAENAGEWIKGKAPSPALVAPLPSSTIPIEG